MKRTVFSNGLIQIADGEIEVAKHAIAGEIFGQIALHLFQEVLGLSLLALRHIESSQRSPGVGILRICIDGTAELLLSFGIPASGLVIAAQR